jgi:formyltetrahydrofolate synthetase
MENNELESTKGQNSALSKLRESIQAKREQRQAVFQSALPLEAKLELMEAPRITCEDNTEFSLERYEQLCRSMNVLYHNYLYWSENLNKDISLEGTQEGFKLSLRDLTLTMEALLSESVKVRFS